MARTSEFGGLSSIGQNERSSINDAVMGLSTNQGLDGLGKSALGLGLGHAFGKANPAFGVIGMAKSLSNINQDRAVAKALGKSYGIPGVVNSINPFGISMTQSLANAMDTDKSGSVSQTEVDNAYGIGMTGSGYGPGVDRSNPSSTTGIDVAMGRDVDQYGFSNNQNTYSHREAANIGLDVQSGIGRGVDTVGLGGLGKAGYTGSVGNAFGFGKAEGVDTADPNSTGASTGIGGSASGVAGMGDESGAGTGSSSSSATAGQDTATSGPTGTSYSSDEQGSGGGSSGGTYICTALYEMGDMKKSIYKYDQIYGKKVDPATYRGYELWGKYVATKLRKKGIVYKIAKPIALTWANQMAYDLSKGKIGKNSTLIKITKTIGEGACYVLGQIFKRRKLWLKST